MASVPEIQEQVAKLLMNEISLDEFEDWFVVYSWNIHKHGDEDAQRLAYAIQHTLSEYDEDSAPLRDALAEVILSSLIQESSSWNAAGDPAPIAESNAKASAVTKKRPMIIS